MTDQATKKPPLRPLSVICGKCGSGLAEPCRDNGIERDHPHRARVRHARWVDEEVNFNHPILEKWRR